MIPIKGIQKISLIDYPGKLCTTLFLGGCNFRCPYCYNVDLVARPEKLKNIAEDDIFKFLEKRKNFLDAVCIGGGEPTLHSELVEFIIKIKKLGFAVKLDTNGSTPEMLKELLDKRLLDYIAMDVKAPLEKYSRIVGVKVDINKIKESIQLIKNSAIDYEFRITVVPNLIEKEDLVAIAQTLKNSKKFVLQQFDNKKTLDKKFQNLAPYPEGVLKDFAQTIKPYFVELKLRI